MNPHNQLFPPSREENSSQQKLSWNDQIHNQTVKKLEEVGDDYSRIQTRLDDIEKEWDLEKIMQAHGASLSLVGLGLGAFVSRKWFLVPGLVAIFALQRAATGWCPSSLLMRKFGFRTRREIDNERAILKARRGDFRHIGRSSAEVLRALEN